MSEKSGGSAKCFEISVGRDKSELELLEVQGKALFGYVKLNIIEAGIYSS